MTALDTAGDGSAFAGVSEIRAILSSEVQLPMPDMYKLLANPRTNTAGRIAMGIWAYNEGRYRAAVRAFTSAGAELVRQVAPGEWINSHFALSSTGARSELESIDFTQLDGPGFKRAVAAAICTGNLDIARRELERASGKSDFDNSTIDVEELLAWTTPRVPGNPQTVIVGYFDDGEPGAPECDWSALVTSLPLHQIVSDRCNSRMRSSSSDPEALRGHAGTDLEVHLAPVSRSCPSSHQLPPGSWLLATGPVGYSRIDAKKPFPRDLNVICLSVSIHPRVFNSEMAGYLRTIGPVGCQDELTYKMLSSADVPAFQAVPLSILLDGTAVADISHLMDRASVQGDVGSFPRAEIRARARRVVQWLANRDQTQADETAGEREVWSQGIERLYARRAIGLSMDTELTCDEALAPIDTRTFTHAETVHWQTRMSDLAKSAVDLVVSRRQPVDVRSRWRRLTEEENAPTNPTSHNEKVDAPVFPVSADPAVGESAQVDIALTFDKNVLWPAITSIEAILTHTFAPRIWILYRGLSSHDVRSIERAYPSAEFRFISMDSVSHGRISVLSHITVSSLDLLLLPQVIPETVDRIVYQDVDALATADLTEVLAVDLSAAALAACDGSSTDNTYVQILRRLPQRRIVTGRHISALVDDSLSRGSLIAKPFNAGFMVLNLRRMRYDRFTTDVLERARAQAFDDQETLNYYASSTRVRLADKWNVRPTSDDNDDYAVLHWIGKEKPWNTADIPKGDVWASYNQRAQARFRSASGQAWGATSDA
jgi:lipopolysaccharide biosynthesis glycosyltransferase